MKKLNQMEIMHNSEQKDELLPSAHHHAKPMLSAVFIVQNMKIVSKLSKAKIPSEMEIGGCIDIERVDFLALSNTNNVLNGFNVKFHLKVSANINDFNIKDFSSTISHNFTQEEFNDFIEHFNKIKI